MFELTGITINEMILWGIIWYASGVGGFLYWWTYNRDFPTTIIPLALAVGLIGPFAWITGAAIHLPTANPKVLLRRRNRRQGGYITLQLLPLIGLFFFTVIVGALLAGYIIGSFIDGFIGLLRPLI